MTILQYIIYMDESGKDGRYFGNFYGGALVRSTDFERVVKTISQLDNTFTQLYYQFFKHAFGLPYSNSSGNPISLR